MSKWNPYALKKPCANCPFLKDKSQAIQLSPGRVPGIVEELLSGESSSFMCHKTVYGNKGGTVSWDEEGNEVYTQSGHEQQCVGSLVLLEKMGHKTQLMQVMQRLGAYDPEHNKDCHDQIIDPEDLNG